MLTTVSTAPPPSPRRERRRVQSREEILDAALEVMTVNGVAALNLTEVAARVGLRQPSLYQYFSSRAAVYDALFERGMRQHADLVRAAIGTASGWAAVRAAMVATVRFDVDSPVLGALLFTRPVPGFTPSERAYAPSLEVYEMVRSALAAAVERGELHPTAATEHGLGLLIALTAGVASHQEANDPGASFEQGRVTPLIGPALDMYQAYFAPGGSGLHNRG